VNAKARPPKPKPAMSLGARPCRLAALVDYGRGAVVSRTLLRGRSGTLTLFAFDRGQGLSEHVAPFHALVQVLEGRLDLTIGSRRVSARAGEAVLMPARIPHALHAPVRAKMLLTMLRGTAS